MVNKQDLLKDLKKFNQELESHLPKLKYDSVRGAIESGGQETDNELLSLLSGNLIDLRTEMALIRKNFAVDIEQMIVRRTQEQQKQFFRYLEKLQGQIFLDLKKNFASYITELSEKVVDLQELEQSNRETLVVLQEEIVAVRVGQEKILAALEEERIEKEHLTKTVVEVNAKIKSVVSAAKLLEKRNELLAEIDLAKGRKSLPKAERTVALEKSDSQLERKKKKVTSLEKKPPEEKKTVENVEEICVPLSVEYENKQFLDLRKRWERLEKLRSSSSL